MRVKKLFLKRWALVVVSGFACAEAASGQDLCSTGQIQFGQTTGTLTVNFRDYFPVKLVTSEDCKVSSSCTYNVAIVSGDQEKTHFEGLEISDLCSLASEHIGEFERHSVSKHAPLLNDEFEFSRTARIVIDTAWGGLGVSRTDFAPNSENVGWLSPLVESGDTLLIASPAATTYEVTISIEEDSDIIR